MKMSTLIRPFVLISTILAAPLLQAEKPQWKLVYDNDTTNLINCDSPFRDTKQPRVFTEEMLRASVREAAIPGMGAQILSPGLGWVPWWKSDIVPLDKHEQWFESYYGKKPRVEEHQFILAGNDMINIFVDECRKHGNAAIISYRVNDSHFKEFAYDKEGYKPQFAHCISQFYVEHPEYRRYPVGKEGWGERNHNWAIPEARQHKLDLVTELIRNYPNIDGVELDILRHPNYFPTDMSIEGRVDIMVDFIKKVRAALDEVAKKTDGKHRYLGTRVYSRNTLWKQIGFEPRAWADAGVDFFNLSRDYNTSDQFTSIAEVRERAPDTAIYSEITHSGYTWKLGGVDYDDHQYRRMTKEMMESTARVDYARGADGVSFFNFAYYRPHGGYRTHKGPFNEPPFADMALLADKQALLKNAGHWYAYNWARDFLYKKGDKTIKTFWIDMLPPIDDSAITLRLLVLSEKEGKHGELDAPEEIDRSGWVVKVNGVALSPVQNTWGAYPFESEIKAGFNKAPQYVAFSVPAKLLKDGVNSVAVSNDDVAQDMILRYVELFQDKK